MEPVTMIGLGLSAAGTASNILGNIFGGNASKTAAENQARLAQLDNQKFILNSVLAQYEAQRIRQETDLDLDYLSFATERQARWLKTISDYDQVQAKAKAAASAKAAADTAMARGQDAVALAEAEAGAIEAKGNAQAAEVRTQTRFKAVMQASEDAEAIGLKRAGFGARMVAATGSALDVLQHEEAMAGVRQKAITILGGMQVDDIQLDTALSASLKRQAGQTQAAGMMRDALTSIDEQSTNLEFALARSQVETSRDVALTEEEGWRTALKMKMSADNTINKTILNASNQLQSAAGAAGQAASYESAGSAAYNTGLTKAGTSLLTGASDFYKIGRDAKLWGTS